MPRRTATGPNGEKLELVDGKWVPMNVPVGFVGPQDEITGLSPSLGRNREEQGRNAAQGWRTGVGAIVANAMSLPHASGKLLAAGGALPALVPGGKSFTEAMAEEERKLPASALLAIPDVSTEEVLAVPGALSRSFAAVNANRNRPIVNGSMPPATPVGIQSTYPQALAAEAQRSADTPIGTAAGQTVGDVASMLTLRPGQRVSKLLPGSLNPRANIDDTKGALDAAARTLLRGTGRTAEAGFDGAVLGALGDGDPLKTAAWTAGIQAGGSAALTAKNAFFRKPLTTFATLFVGHEMWKAVAPGPQDFFESKDQAINEMVAAYGLGLAARLVGAGRDPNRVINALEHASRAGIASVVAQLQDAAENNQPQYARVLELLAQDQERFGTDARVLLERAARSDEPRALLNQIDALMQSTRFRKALEEEDAPSEPEAQPSQSFANWLTSGGGR